MMQNSYKPPYPVIASEKMMQRMEGDGMDSEVLRLQDLKSSPYGHSQRPTSHSSKHRNLKTSEKTTTVDKNVSVKFIPREPVKGAVRAVATTGPKKGHSTHSTQQSYSDSRKSKASLNAPENLVEYKITPQKSVDTSKVAQNRKTSPSSRTVDEVKINIVESPVQMAAKLVTVDDVRSIEGQVDSETDAQKLQRELLELQNKFDVQLKINEDLKKLLVASMGDDLHYKMEAIVRTKAHLAMEVGDYTEKMYQDYENLDKLSIQADMWRSKYMALRVFADELSSLKTDLTERCQQYQHAMGTLMQEMQQILEFNSHTYRYLYQLQDALGMKTRRMGIGRPDNPLNLANINMQLADSVRFTMIGSVPASPAPVDTSATNFRTPGENMAMQVLSTPIPDVTKNILDNGLLPTPAVDKFSRFHPMTRYENITFNCCAECSGELQVV